MKEHTADTKENRNKKLVKIGPVQLKGLKAVKSAAVLFETFTLNDLGVDVQTFKALVHKELVVYNKNCKWFSTYTKIKSTTIEITELGEKYLSDPDLVKSIPVRAGQLSNEAKRLISMVVYGPESGGVDEALLAVALKRLPTRSLRVLLRSGLLRVEASDEAELIAMEYKLKDVKI